MYEGKYNFSDGWREAKVIQIGVASEIEKPLFSDCRDTASPEQLSTGKFIVLVYEHLDHQRKRVIPLKPTDGVRVGDLVYMNVSSCEASLVPRALQNVK